MTSRNPAQPIARKIKPAVDKAIDRMEEHQLKLTKQPFTPTDLLILFVNPQYHTMLVDAYAVSASGGTETLYVKCEVPREYGSGVAYVCFSWSGFDRPDYFLVPRRAGGSTSYPAALLPTKPELAAKFVQVVDDLIGIHHKFQLVRRTLNLLNQQARSLAQLRYHWPCIVPILRDARYADLADSLADPVSRAGSGAMFTSELKLLLARTNETIANHQLMADLPVTDNLPVPYELRHGFH